MQLRRLGTSGLQVSAVGIGCNNFGSRIGPAEVQAVVDAAIEAGITLFDTADVYADQKSEVLLGAAIGKRRHEVVIATKFASPTSANPMDRGGGRRHVMAAVDASLKRLGTDYIDLYQMHGPDSATPIAETLMALDDVVKAGKVRYIGSSNMSGWQVADADWTAQSKSLNRFVSVQNHYNILDRQAAAELIPAAGVFGQGLLPYFPLASGLLSGKYRRGEAPGADTRMGAWGARFAAQLNDANFDRIERLEAWAEARGHTLLDLAFAWLLGQPVVSSVIAGATSPAQAKGNAAAGAWILTPAEVAEVTALDLSGGAYAPTLSLSVGR